jgi:RNA 3'-terminal phosphate cyclase (ATP)
MITRVLTPAWRLMGVALDYAEIIPGFHPQGGGEAEVRVHGPGFLEPLAAEGPFRAVEVGVEVVICGLPVHLAEQALEGAVGRLELHGYKPSSELRRPRAAGRGMAMLVWAREASGLAVGFASLGRRGGQPGALGLEAAETLASFLKSGAGLSGDLAAVLAAPLACARGVSRITLDRNTPGLRTALKTVEAFFPGAVRLVERPNGGLNELTIRGSDWGLLTG